MPNIGRTNRRNMTQRQIERRRSMPIKNNNIGSKFKIDFARRSTAELINGDILININKVDVNNVSVLDLDKVINTLNSPIKLENNNYDDIYKLKPKRKNMFHFGMYMNNIGHYSGGRYYLVELAYYLAEIGHKVTIVSDRKAFFVNDFRYIDIGNRIEWVTDERCGKTRWLINSPENQFDFLIQSPLVPSTFAYSEKWRVPLYAVLFESPNYVSEYRGGLDSTEAYWKPYKTGIEKYANSLICISEVAKEKAKDWLKLNYNGDYNLIQPSINTRVSDRVGKIKTENEIIFVGRHVEFKNPIDIIVAIGKMPKNIRPVINFVGSHSSKVRMNMIDVANANGVNIKFYASINDEEKFFLIKKSKLMVYPSNFEGFGMPPAEAIYCKKPVIAYDIPVLRGEYHDSIDYVKEGDIKSLCDKITYYLQNNKERIQRGKKSYKYFYHKNRRINCLPEYMKKSLRNIFYHGKDLSITAGMIVLNGEDTIELALKSCYESVDKIIIVEGAVEDYSTHNTSMRLDLNKIGKGKVSNYASIDNTGVILDNFKDPLNKIEIVNQPNGRYWKNKNEMQNEIAKRVDTDLYLKVDADEIFIESDIEYMKRYFMVDPKLYVLNILKYEFWKSFNNIAVGGQWDRPQSRMWRWNKHFIHSVDDKVGFNYFIDSEGDKVSYPKYKSLSLMEKLCYHLGYYRDVDQIKAKINYYKNRGIENNVVDNFTNWKEGMPTNSTHPLGTTIREFDGILPLILRPEYFDKISINNVEEKFDNNINMIHSPSKKRSIK